MTVLSENSTGMITKKNDRTIAISQCLRNGEGWITSDMSVTVNLETGAVIGSDMSKLLYIRNYVITMIISQQGYKAMSKEDYQAMSKDINTAIEVLKNLDGLMNIHKELNQSFRRNIADDNMKFAGMISTIFDCIGRVVDETNDDEKQKGKEPE